MRLRVELDDDRGPRVRVFRLRLADPNRAKDGTVAHFDVEVFGQLNLRGCQLRLREDGRFFFAVPSRARVLVHGFGLRTAITAEACAAYRAERRRARPPPADLSSPPANAVRKTGGS